jgi:hypothetical protein
MELISYGAISSDFKTMAQLSKLLTNIKNVNVEQSRLDCYPVVNVHIGVAIEEKFDMCGLPRPEQKEVFLPSKNYPAHTDEGGISYFIGLEEGVFTISGVSYNITPFVLYSFEDSKLHNTNFGAIMLK